MLTEVKAYSEWSEAPTLPLADGGRAETDLIQVRNIEGLQPVKASVNTTPFGAVDGASFVGSNVLSRNIVLTLHPNPNWKSWTYESLRKLLYDYFMPKRKVRLVFYSDDMIPVEILGIVEDVNVNIFSKDPELIVSIICPDPYFTAVEPVVISGQTIHSRVEAPGLVVLIDYKGNIEAGVNLKVTATAAAPPSYIAVELGNIMKPTYFGVNATVNPTMYFELSSIPMRKYVQNVNTNFGTITNLLSKLVDEGSKWPTLQPGENRFSVRTDSSAGAHQWTLTYFERFGGL